MLHQYREKISKLRQTDAYFARLFEEHNALDQKIKNMESGIEVATNAVIENLKKEKLLLKDKIHSILQKVE